MKEFFSILLVGLRSAVQRCPGIVFTVGACGCLSWYLLRAEARWDSATAAQAVDNHELRSQLNQCHASNMALISSYSRLEADQQELRATLNALIARRSK